MDIHVCVIHMDTRMRYACGHTYMCYAYGRTYVLAPGNLNSGLPKAGAARSPLRPQHGGGSLPPQSAPLPHAPPPPPAAAGGVACGRGACPGPFPDVVLRQWAEPAPRHRKRMAPLPSRIPPRRKRRRPAPSLLPPLPAPLPAAGGGPGAPLPLSPRPGGGRAPGAEGRARRRDYFSARKPPLPLLPGGSADAQRVTSGGLEGDREGLRRGEAAPGDGATTPSPPRGRSRPPAPPLLPRRPGMRSGPLPSP